MSEYPQPKIDGCVLDLTLLIILQSLRRGVITAVEVSFLFLSSFYVAAVPLQYFQERRERGRVASENGREKGNPEREGEYRENAINTCILGVKWAIPSNGII